MKPRNPADTRAPQRIAMVRFAERHELRLPRLRILTLPPILKRHLERDFIRRRTIAGEEHMLRVSRRDLAQPLRQPSARVASHPQRRAMGNSIQLLANRSIDP